MTTEEKARLLEVLERRERGAMLHLGALLRYVYDTVNLHDTEDLILQAWRTVLDLRWYQNIARNERVVDDPGPNEPAASGGNEVGSRVEFRVDGHQSWFTVHMRNGEIRNVPMARTKAAEFLTECLRECMMEAGCNR